MERDLKSRVDVAASLQPAARAASGTGSGVDLRGYDSAFGIFAVGAWTDGTHTPKLQESDVDVAGSYTDVGTADLQGSFTAVSGTAAQNAVQRVGYIGFKRYVRGFITVAGGTTGAVESFHVMRGHPARQPLP